MCQSSVYALDRERQELLVDEVARVKVEDGRITVEPLLGAPVSLAVRIREIDLMEHRIVVERVPG